MTAIGFPSGSSQSPIFGFDPQPFHTTLTTAGFTLWVVKITDIRFRITAFSHQCDHTRIASGSLKYSIFDFDSLPSHTTVTTIGFTSGSLRSPIFDSYPLPSQSPVTTIGVVTSGSLKSPIFDFDSNPSHTTGVHIRVIIDHLTTLTAEFTLGS